MTRTQTFDSSELQLRLVPLLQQIWRSGDDAPSTEEKFTLIKNLPGDDQSAVIQALLQRLNDSEHAIDKLNVLNKGLHKTVQQLTRHPLHVAIFKCWVDVGDRTLAMVSVGGEDRLVTLAPDLDKTRLGAGETVFLSAQRNAVLFSPSRRPAANGQLGKVCEVHGEAGIIVRDHDQEITLERAHWLGTQSFKQGDQIIWCPRTRLVLELLKSSAVAGVEQLAHEIKEAPPRFAGYAEVRDDIISGFTCAVTHPETAARYGVNPADSALLLFGPPGCGKTLLVRNLAHEIGARLFCINASAIYSPWVGESEQRLMDAFRKAREAAPALLFIDEIDALARVRGSAGQQHSDRVASVLLTQMEGAAGSPGVGVIGACNRVDLLDSALRSRFGRQFFLAPPKRDALREIVAVHLSDNLPYRGEETRTRCIDVLVQGLTSPNGNNEIATLRFRDGKNRVVKAHDLVSGRAVKQVVNFACDAAFRREVDGGIAGIELLDMELAVERMILHWREMLCVSNVRGYLNDLPDDVDVVAVEPLVDNARPSLYLQAGNQNL